MLVSVVHLSDIHIKSAHNPVADRAKSIVDALFSFEPNVDICILALTGDIAYSGKAEEYVQALTFVLEIQSHITQRNKAARVELVAVPGNHDCDFSADTSMRDIILVAALQQIDEMDPCGKPVEELVKVQTNFFDFRKVICDSTPDSTLDRLCSTRNIELHGQRIQIHCYNTAFLSKLNEDQGKLLFPLKAAQSNIKFDERVDLSISILHHPANWLESTNETKFTRFLEKTSDVVFTGHQHVENAIRKQSLADQYQILYVSGDALQNGSSEHSGFNIFFCDLTHRKYKLAHLTWRGLLYLPERPVEWENLERNDAARHLFANSKAFSEKLAELGTGFTHPRRKNLKLTDLFIYPDLRILNVLKDDINENQESAAFSATALYEHVESNDQILILGGHQAGKTSLAKILYKDFQRAGKYVPLLVDGGLIKAASEVIVLKRLYEAFEEQYSHELLDSYKQLPRQRRLLILDDLDHSRLNRKHGFGALIKIIERFFGKAVVLADDLFQFEELAAEGGEGAFLQFERLLILPLTRQQRGKLIEKWHVLGEELTYEQRLLTQGILNVERFVEDMIWKDLLPCYPVFVLAALQSYEATRAPSATASSYGSIYEALLTRALFHQSGNPVDVEKDMILLSRLAFFMFSQELQCASKEQISDVCRTYSALYHIPADPARLILDATAAQILTSSDNSYRFRYRYSYYYFVGKYFATNLQDDDEGPSLRAKLLEMSDYVYYDEYANVLLFALYLSKDGELIRHLVKNADEMYSDREVCDLDKHVAFLNRANLKSQDVLPDPNVKKNREMERQEQEALDSLPQIDSPGEKIKYNAQLDDVVKLNIAFKSLQLLGQVVRDSPASLKADIKVEAIRAVYQLGLRVLRVVLQDTEDNLENVKAYIAKVVSRHKNYETPIELARATDHAVTFIARACTFAIIKRISFAVGLEKLEQSYSVLLSRFESVASIRLVDLSIRLDHFTDYPEGAIQKLVKDFRDNFFASRILKDIVLNHMRLVELEHRTRQRIAELLDARHNATPFMLAPKRLKKGHGG